MFRYLPTNLDNVNQYDISYKKLYNFLYIHLCRIPYAVKKSQSYAPEDGQKIARNMLS